MNILIISPFRIYPIYSGFSTRVYNLTKQLSSSNSVFLFYIDYYKKYSTPDDYDFLPNVKKHNFKVSTKFMQFLNPYLIMEAVSTIKKGKIDIIIAEGIWAGLHAMILSFLTKVPYCLTEHNAEYVRWKRMGRNSYILKKFEKLCCTYSDKIISMSDVDKELIHRLGIDIGKIVTIPNGFDDDIFKPNSYKRGEIRGKLNVGSETPIILFSGSLDYTPNYQSVQIIHDILLDKILDKIPTAKFLIVGSNPPLQYEHESIIFTDRVERIEDYINTSDLVIAPLISGGGTKLKIIEAIACGKSVVTTSIGAEGLICNETSQFLHIFDEWDSFAHFIVEFLKNNTRDYSISENKDFIRRYSWTYLGFNFNEILESIIKPKN